MLAAAVLAGPASAQVRRGVSSTPDPISMAVSMRGATLEDAALPLSETKKWSALVNMQEPIQAPVLGCIYRKPASKDYRLDFWDGKKPDLNRQGSMSLLRLNVAVQACPATWGEAVALGWGPDAWAKAVAEQKVFAAGNEAYAAEVAAKTSGTPETRAAAWRAAASSMTVPSDAELLALARKIDTDIGSLEGNLNALNSRPFNDKLVGAGGLFERITLLAKVAYVKSASLKPGPAGRPGFDAWDEQLGGPALTAIDRLQKIVYYRMNRRVRLAEAVNGDAGESEMKSWGNVDFSPLFPAQTSLLEVFEKQLGGQPLVDPAFQLALTKDLERIRPSGDPGLPYYYHVPADPKPTWLMTPAEEEAQGSKIGSNLVSAVTGVGDLVRLIEKVDTDIRTSRVAFWKCYASRCQKAGETFYAYSYAMRNKDDFYFVMPVAMGPMVARGMSFLGNGSIDGGPVSYCAGPGNALGGVLATAVKQNAGNPVESARAIQTVMKGPSYLAWQTCRDRMEYILRPRFLS